MEKLKTFSSVDEMLKLTKEESIALTFMVRMSDLNKKNKNKRPDLVKKVTAI